MISSRTTRYDGNEARFRQRLWLKPLKHTTLGLAGSVSKGLAMQTRGSSLTPSTHIKKLRHVQHICETYKAEGGWTNQMPELQTNEASYLHTQNKVMAS